jgi:hypothetical protein
MCAVPMTVDITFMYKLIPKKKANLERSCTKCWTLFIRMGGGASPLYIFLKQPNQGGHKEMSSISADRYESKWGGGEEGGGVAGSQTISTAVQHMEPKLALEI